MSCEVVKGELLLLLSIAICNHEVMNGSHHCCHLLLLGDEGKDVSWSDEGKLLLLPAQF